MINKYNHYLNYIKLCGYMIFWDLNVIVSLKKQINQMAETWLLFLIFYHSNDSEYRFQPTHLVVKGHVVISVHLVVKVGCKTYQNLLNGSVWESYDPTHITDNLFMTLMNSFTTFMMFSHAMPVNSPPEHSLSFQMAICPWSICDYKTVLPGSFLPNASLSI